MERYISLTEAARISGDSVSTLTRAIIEGQLHAFKPRGRWKIKEADLAKYVESNSIGAVAVSVDSLLADIGIR